MICASAYKQACKVLKNSYLKCRKSYTYKFLVPPDVKVLYKVFVKIVQILRKSTVCK